jgi:hypothetical protein
MTINQAIQFLDVELTLADVRWLQTDQLKRFEHALHHWEQLANWELRKRARISKEEEAE